MWSPSMKAAIGLIVIAVLGGIALFRAVEPFGTTGETADGLDVEEAIARIRCDRTRPVDRMEAPIRGGAAVRGVVCDSEAGLLHIFEAARIGQSNRYRLDYSDLFGIERQRTGEGTAPCDARLLLGRGLIIVVGSAAASADVSEHLGGGFVEQAVTRTPASYDLPCTY